MFEVVRDLLEFMGISELIQWVKSSASSLIFKTVVLSGQGGRNVYLFLRATSVSLYEDNVRDPFYVEPDGLLKELPVGSEDINLVHSGNHILFMWRGALIFLSTSVDDGMERCCIQFLRGTLDPRELIAEADRFALSRQPNTCTPGMVLIRYQSGLPQSLNYNQILETNRLPGIHMDHSQRDVFDDLGRWLDKKDWYEKNGIPFCRGYLFHGKPGTGKSFFATALAGWYGLDIVTCDLATQTNSSFKNLWSSQEHFPHIFLLEDIDAVFEGRQNVAGASETPLTWDCFLNCIAGVTHRENTLLIVTTNRPEVLDEALATVKDGKVVVRPGRIDKAVEFGPLSEKGREWVVNVVLKRYGEDSQELVRRGEGMTGAQFKELCIQEALKAAWGEG